MEQQRPFRHAEKSADADGAGTVTSLAKIRDGAISIACGLLDRKINVREIGPLLGMRDPGDIIDSVEIRKLRATRIPAG